MSGVEIIGAGLAGCEAAWALAQAGIAVTLWEMKPQKYSPAHTHSGFAELVCSNSLKASRLGSAAGLLKEEMRRLGSLTVECAYKTAVGAGGALAVDRTAFSDLVTSHIRSHPLIQVREGEVEKLPRSGNVIVATGPLTSDALAADIADYCGGDTLSFFDAAAPIVTAQSLDTDRVFFAARYGRGEADYINCPFNREEYEAFYEALVSAQGVELRDFEQRPLTVYEGCMPVEIMAKRGPDTLRFGPMKPVGLTNPETGHRPWAVVQLRQENTGGTLYNLVGFQTNLKFPEQKRVFSMIPGLENAEFVRYGVMHRNTFLDSPRLLSSDFSLQKRPELYFAGQITGVEGYMESAASGILAGQNLARKLGGKHALILPEDTMLGALTAYISDPGVEKFQPMGANMGLLPPLPERVKEKALRYEQIAQRAIASLEKTLKDGDSDESNP
ncbi:methylenetetrahydrofolate--tRNA-(uracil(54)-C(5))-methyltransferase (FADH(2)-oxidizing) TrmFO [Oscillospiraceae bacterium MB08-C2-2]|nr:methylenetetrahydrofolate--tRNA-(uracil(54)-C(5))-methyltransferase (FADH(2)-oxidizing) TrmFO [Oscillospiraceae bacterium MB08-C2-2]